ncbi:MAG: hypothetical protein U0998_05525 [Moraxellaceae bacterium]|nr:hypothetical protein [Moraxellaceae bacterium]MDP1776809.1 hypothetical protein [Moraxellaceae bacterium]MDZ4296958.1 hypothetical protein [Moraxellaceae bacterium]MDZ4386667.1 hypothetical protein [Moraxellaceae bacterium]
MATHTKAWWMLPLLLTAVNANALSLAQERQDQFMQVCMTDATVAAGNRNQLCRCLFDAFAYGSDTRFGVTDVLTIPERNWEAPARRMANDALGNEVRRLRQRCLEPIDGR